ncbi:MAG: class I SAM-dependent methyltransferase [Tardiphaga sp.]|jgi:ubiquinone/menaquinone biosynthesis C-methylase UbiE
MTTRHPALFEGTEMPTAGWWDALWPNPAGVLEAVGLRRDMAAIDLCCGDGWFTLPMSKVAASVVAIDIDRNMLEAARDRLAAAGATNYEFVEGDAYELARHMRGPADFVLMANAFHGVPDQPRLADAIGKALKPAGRLAVVNWHQRRREETTILGEPRGPKSELRMSPEQTIASIEAGGLIFAGLVELPPYHYAVIMERP